MVKVEVSPDILNWAAQRAGKENIIQDEFPKWGQWINKESQPTFNQLEKISKFTSTPLGLFFLPAPPKEKLPVPHYRTTNDRGNEAPSSNLLETVQTMQRRQEWMRDYLSEIGYDRLSFVGRGDRRHDPKKIAKDIRIQLGLERGWSASCPNWQAALTMLINRIEDIGILVVVNGIVGNNTKRKLDVDEFRGFVLVDDLAPLIFVNNSDGKAAQMFTLAHELAHVWYGESAAFDLYQLQPADAEIERLCNLVAAEFLVPEDELRKVWPALQDDADRYQTLARHFKVSEVVIARRSLDLTLITRPEFFDFYNNRYLKGVLENPTSPGGGDFYLNQPYRISRRFAKAVITATKEGRLLYQEAYRLTGIKGKTFENFAARLGYGGEI
ncbi:ImmA/IrrE family metallo-endopeptidase [Paenibacillus tepidiphilus]|uniref:ImmA/IrrE family metallo-endopeptidase n=1 Tax=Paenibacillus tepidiphilus TaxID=2608683 RepID=UPI00123BF956|nr:ImmA/IrrE family metallo-endopeptidase [Paenibacillus tepidiphilus]